MRKVGGVLTSIGVGLFVHGFWAVIFREAATFMFTETPWGAGRLDAALTIARLEAAIGAALAVGGLLLYRARK